MKSCPVPSPGSRGHLWADVFEMCILAYPRGDSEQDVKVTTAFFEEKLEEIHVYMLKL